MEPAGLLIAAVCVLVVVTRGRALTWAGRKAIKLGGKAVVVHLEELGILRSWFTRWLAFGGTIAGIFIAHRIGVSPAHLTVVLLGLVWLAWSTRHERKGARKQAQILSAIKASDKRTAALAVRFDATVGNPAWRGETVEKVQDRRERKRNGRGRDGFPADTPEDIKSWFTVPEPPRRRRGKGGQ